MSATGGELADVQKELAAVKQALQKDEGYLGMTGEPLQQYFLQLNDKEIFLLSRQMQQLSAAGGTIVKGVNGGHTTAPNVPPSGPPKQFDKDDVDAVLHHMRDYEAIPQEAVKALRALSSLAYAQSKSVGNNDQILKQVMRLLSLHPEESMVQVYAIKSMCNMAFDTDAATNKLNNQEVLSALLQAASLMPDDNQPKVLSETEKKALAAQKPPEAALKAGEALARIVAAEAELLQPNAAGGADKANARAPEASTLAGVFLAACYGDAAWHAAVLRLVAQLVENEVINMQFIAERFVLHTMPKDKFGAKGWLAMAKAAASSSHCPELGNALVEAGALRAAVQLMQRYTEEAPVALAGLEAMASIVGTRAQALQAFVDAGGVQRIESGMERFPEIELLQTKSIRALASGVLWSDDVQRKAGYSSKRAVALTKAAMVRHGGSEELQVAALDALSRYLDKAGLTADVLEGGGEGLVKAVMARHIGCSKVQKIGRSVLDFLGVDKSWKPAGRGTNGSGR